MPSDLTATALLEAFTRRTLSPVEVAKATLSRIEQQDGAINAFVTITPERALDDAARAEADHAAGNAGLLAGVPYSLKDLVPTRGIPTGYGSTVFRDADPLDDAPIAARLRASGGVLLGKTTTPELGWKGDSGNALNGPCHNPWRHGRTAGGSSGGAAAAAAAGFGPLHQGSDGAGSIRIPAAFCGVFGLKPSYGLVPHPRSTALGISHLGPIARTVADAALLLDAIVGVDARDRYSVPAAVPSHLAALAEPLPPLRIAFSPDLGYATVEPDVAALVASAVTVFADLGHAVEPIELALADPWPIEDELWIASYAAAVGDRLAGDRERLDPGLVPVAERGLRRRAADLVTALEARTAWCTTLHERLAPYDLLLCPTVPCTAFAAGDDGPGIVAGRTVSYLEWTSFTYPFNLTGQPAATVPCGLADGLPVGLQIVGARLADALVLRAAAAFEAARPWPLP